MSTDESADPIDNGPDTEGPPKTIPELWDRLIAAEIARDADRDKKQTARDSKRDAELALWKAAELLWKENHERDAREQRKAFFDELNMHGKRLDLVERSTKFGAHGPLWAIVFVIGLAVLVEVYRIDHPAVRYVMASTLRP